MTRLTKVELLRLWWRRLPQIAAVASLGFVVVFLLGLGQQVASLEEQRAEAEQMYEENLRWWQESQSPEMVAECLEQQARERELADDPTIDFGCRQPPPRLEDFLWGPPDLAAAYGEVLVGIAAALLAVVLVMGASSTAAEFAHRTIGTWLTFEPRRSRVWASKVAAAALAAVPVTLAFLALAFVGPWLIYTVGDQPTTVTGDQWGDLAWTSLRLLLLAVLICAVGAAAGLLLRHTGAVLGVLVAYFIAVEGMLRQLLPGMETWLLSVNINAVLRGGYSWTSYDCSSDAMNCREVVHTLSMGRGLVYLAVLALVVLVASWWATRERDVD